ncbi:MAG: MlaD family protein [Solirubrobacteraceae bacterium]|nr:MlaD family protein [Solirubrobacteraceae bacterium]
MNRQVPTLGKLLTMVIFALSCFGLTLFMWLQFGGAVPFKAEGYRISTTFPEATQLSVEADIRIAGVAVGRVKQVTPGTDGRSVAVLEVKRRFAPLPKGTKAILRQKTLLGETYVSLTPPSKLSGALIPEGGRIPNADVGSTVELDEVFATFNPETRKYFQQWMQDGGAGLDGKGTNAGKALVELQLLVKNLGDATKVLNEEAPSLRAGLRDGTTVLNAATSQRGAIENAIEQSNRVFKQTADQDAALTALVQKLPKLLTATKTGTKAIENFATETGPAVDRLQPTAKALGPAARSLADVAPELKQLLVGVERVNKAAVDGIPATEKTLEVLPVILDGLDPFLKELNPIVEYASLYTDELTGALGNITAATQGRSPVATEGNYRNGRKMNFIRGGVTIQNSSTAASPNRFSTDQANAYRRPGWASQIGAGLAKSFSLQSCGQAVPRIPDTDNAALNELESVQADTKPSPDTSAIDALRYTLFSPFGFYPDSPTSSTPSQVPAPTTPLTAPAACDVQAPFSLSAGKLTTYPQLPAAPTSTERSVTGN